MVALFPPWRTRMYFRVFQVKKCPVFLVVAGISACQLGGQGCPTPVAYGGASAVRDLQSVSDVSEAVARHERQERDSSPLGRRRVSRRRQLASETLLQRWLPHKIGSFIYWNTLIVTMIKSIPITIYGFCLISSNTTLLI